MAYTRINWENKPSIDTPINATNLNKVDKTLFEVSMSGWVAADETWTYVSTDDPTGIIKIQADVTGKYSLGMRIKFTNDSNVIYGILTKIGTYGGDVAGYTYLTFLHEIDPTDNLALYLMANSAITLNYYSNMKVPFGFPLDTDKWSITVTDTTNREQTSPTKNQWYNLGGIYIDVPIGAWSISYSVMLYAKGTSTTFVFANGTLSTDNNTQSDPLWTTRIGLDSPSGTLAKYATVFRTRNITLTSNTRFYINSSMNAGTAASLQNPNAASPLIIKAICAYL